MSTITARESGVQVPAVHRPNPALKFLRRLPMRILLTLLLIAVVYPLVWLVINSLKSQSDYLNSPTWSLPHELVWQNYIDAWTTGNLSIFIRNSIIATVPSLAMIIAFGTAAGFALQVMVFKGRSTIQLLFLAGIMVPVQMILLPLFTIYYSTNLTGTLLPLIITYTGTGLPLTVFMMATYFRSIPMSVFEAATLDGASILRTFWSIAFPLVRNAVLTVGLVQFFFIWNDLLVALTFTNTTELRTIQVGLLNFTGEFGSMQYGPLFAAICINVFGILAIYLFLNQQVMKGLTSGAVKG